MRGSTDACACVRDKGSMAATPRMNAVASIGR